MPLTGKKLMLTNQEVISLYQTIRDIGSKTYEPTPGLVKFNYWMPRNLLG